MINPDEKIFVNNSFIDLMDYSNNGDTCGKGSLEDIRINRGQEKWNKTK